MLNKEIKRAHKASATFTKLIIYLTCLNNQHPFKSKVSITLARWSVSLITCYDTLVLVKKQDIKNGQNLISCL